MILRRTLCQPVQCPHENDRRDWNESVAVQYRRFSIAQERMTGMVRAPEEARVSPMRSWDAAGHYILAPTRRVEAWRYRCYPASPSV